MRKSSIPSSDDLSFRHLCGMLGVNFPTNLTMKSGARSGSGPDADIPRNHAIGSRSITSQPYAIELGRLRPKRANGLRMASRFGRALYMQAKPKSGGT